VLHLGVEPAVGDRRVRAGDQRGRYRLPLPGYHLQYLVTGAGYSVQHDNRLGTHLHRRIDRVLFQR